MDNTGGVGIERIWEGDLPFNNNGGVKPEGVP